MRKIICLKSLIQPLKPLSFFLLEDFSVWPLIPLLDFCLSFSHYGYSTCDELLNFTCGATPSNLFVVNMAVNPLSPLTFSSIIGTQTHATVCSRLAAWKLAFCHNYPYHFCSTAFLLCLCVSLTQLLGLFDESPINAWNQNISTAYKSPIQCHGGKTWSD